MRTVSSRAAALIAARIIDEKKGTDIVIKDLRELSDVTDYFVIATAVNKRRAYAIVDELKEKMYALGGIKASSVEGLVDAAWILLDYGCIVIHIFMPAQRDFYRLEQLWDEALLVNFNDADSIDASAFTSHVMSEGKQTIVSAQPNPSVL